MPIGHDRDDDLTGLSARTMDELAELIDDWDQSREGWQAIRDKAYELWTAGLTEGRRQVTAELAPCTRCGHADSAHRANATCTGDHTSCPCTRVPVGATG